jgi:hypothetical protein
VSAGGGRESRFGVGPRGVGHFRTVATTQDRGLVGPGGSAQSPDHLMARPLDHPIHPAPATHFPTSLSAEVQGTMRASRAVRPTIRAVATDVTPHPPRPRRIPTPGGARKFELRTAPPSPAGEKNHPPAAGSATRTCRLRFVSEVRGGSSGGAMGWTFEGTGCRLVCWKKNRAASMRVLA